MRVVQETTEMSPNFQSSARPEELMYVADTPERDPKATTLLKKPEGV